MISDTRCWESVADVTQPRRIDDSASASLPHRVKSLAAILLATLSATKVSKVDSTALAAEPKTLTLIDIT